jgi:hypothetical protein
MNRIRSEVLSSTTCPTFVERADILRTAAPLRWTWIGAGIIIACGLFIAFREHYLRTL